MVGSSVRNIPAITPLPATSRHEGHYFITGLCLGWEEDPTFVIGMVLGT